VITEVAMENFIVRISRRNAKEPEQVTGEVEIVGKEEKKAFKSIEELMQILSSQEKGSDIRFCVE
jgi:hypothetical protein